MSDTHIFEIFVPFLLFIYILKILPISMKSVVPLFSFQVIVFFYSFPSDFATIDYFRRMSMVIIYMSFNTVFIRDSADHQKHQFCVSLATFGSLVLILEVKE